MSPRLGYPTHHLAKDLIFVIDEWSIYTGRALEFLSSAPYDGCAFPQARNLVLSFVLDRFDMCTLADLPLSVNVRAFVQRIRNMAPMVRKISIETGFFGKLLWATPYFGILVSQLFQLTNSIEYHCGLEADLPTCLLPDLLCNLVDIRFDVKGYNCPSIQLARQSAPTLQSLTLISLFVANFADLIQSPDGSYVSYPTLHTLNLRDETEDEIAKYVVFKDFVPFPRLRCLCLFGCYPFGDDVLFRGNAGTLQCLEMMLSDLLVSIIIEYNVFTPTSHPKLQYVETRYPLDAMPLAFNTTADSLQFMLSIGQGAPVRDIEGAESSVDLVPALMSSYNFACIQILILPFFYPELWDVVALVKELPLLSDLQTSVVILGPMPIGVTKSELPEYLITTYAPIGKRFQCWKFDYECHDDDSNIAECVFLLALVCPNFTFAGLILRSAAEYKMMLEAAITSDMFRKYASRLQCFLS
ncbi:hypothetical protein GGF42_000767 [Coemansia sp. RSA 2424]|nr:hypothetical protein GGF42_000767 [Coemansia sp. RSA 2424]